MLALRNQSMLLCAACLSLLLAGALSTQESYARGVETVQARSGLHPAALLTPTLTAQPGTAEVGTTTLLRGTGFSPNNRVSITLQRPDGTTKTLHVLTGVAGILSLRIGFSPFHGLGMEFVRAVDLATGTQAPLIGITIVASSSTRIMGDLSALPNPVMNGHAAIISGHGFTPRSRILVTWLRPDGSVGRVRVFSDEMGSFAFRLLADPRHGCGPRRFIAFTPVVRTRSGLFTLGEIC